MKRYFLLPLFLLFLISALVLGGCAGCGNKEQEQAATPKLEAPVQVDAPTVSQESDLPSPVRRPKFLSLAELYAPDPDERKTPDHYRGDPLFYVPGVEYIDFTSSSGTSSTNDSMPTIPDDKRKEYSRFLFGISVVSDDKANKEKVKKAAAFLVEGMSLIDAAKFLAKIDSTLHIEDAREYIERAIEADPDNFEAHLIRAELLSSDEKEAAYRKLYEWKPESLRVILNVSRYLDRDEEIRLLEKVAQRAPTYRRGLALRSLGDFYYENGDSEKALSVLRKQYELFPSDEMTYKYIKLIEKGEPLIKALSQ